MSTITHNGKEIPTRMPLNIAIVGGGKACKFFLELLRSDYLKHLDINLIGVCDTNPEAEGFLMAKKMGIYTTRNFRDFFHLKNLDSIIELTNSRDVLLDLVKQRPKGVGVVEHNIGRFFRSFYFLNQRLKSAEYEVSHEKLFSKFLIQQSTAAIVVLNTDYTIEDVNEPYLKMVGKTREDVLGSLCYNIYYGLKAPCSIAHTELQCPMLETIQTGKSAHVIHEFPHRKDRPSYCNIVTYPQQNRNGEVTQVIELVRDITKEFSSKYEARIKELKEDLNKMIQEDRMISLGKLAASCVHEINNPIQGLLTFSDLMQEILKEGDLTPDNVKKFKKFITLMSGELERCGNIISGLLSFSREIPLEYKRVIFNDILDAVINLTRHKMELQNILLTTDLCPGLLIVKGNANRLQQTLLNLVFNAIEAMPNGGDLAIKSRLDDQKQEIQIEIRDSGHGISEKNLDHIFDPFFTTKKEGEGTGLGLSIVYGVVNNHGGKIDVKSKENEGTVFILKFPKL